MRFFDTVFQQVDPNGFTLPDTEFTVTLQLSRKAKGCVYTVKIQVPQINFQTQCIFAPSNPLQFTFVLGGTIATARNPLPEKYRPSVNETFVVSNNDSVIPNINNLTPTQPTLSPVFNFEITADGYIRITNPNIYLGVIPMGGHTLNPTIIKYDTTGIVRVKDIQLVDPRFLNITQFTVDDGIRDSHTNYNYDGTLSVSFTANFGQSDLTQLIMDTYVGIAKNKCSRDWKVLNLTNFVNNINANQGYSFSWDTSVVQSHLNPDLILASAGLVNYTSGGAVPVWFKSTNHGKSFSGPIQVDPVTFPMNNIASFGDCRGFATNDEGDFLYSVTLETLSDNPLGNYTQMLFYFNGGDGNSLSLAYATTNGADGIFDFPQICAGQNGLGQKGFIIYADWIPMSEAYENLYTVIGFLPVTNHQIGPVGGGYFGDGTMQVYPKVNNTSIASICADPEGRVYFHGAPAVTTSLYGIFTSSQCIKQPPNATYPDPLDPALLEYSTTIQNTSFALEPPVSYPVFDYFNSVNTNAYDTRRNVLYTAYTDVDNYESQNYKLWLAIAYNKGVSYQKKYLIGSNKWNRGFHSLAYDKKTGTLLISYYSSENSADGTELQYLARLFSSEELDEMVKL